MQVDRKRYESAGGFSFWLLKKMHFCTQHATLTSTGVSTRIRAPFGRADKNLSAGCYFFKTKFARCVERLGRYFKPGRYLLLNQLGDLDDRPGLAHSICHPDLKTRVLAQKLISAVAHCKGNYVDTAGTGRYRTRVPRDVFS